MTVEIRAATRSDADGITDVQVASWRAAYTHVFSEALLFSDDFDAKRREFWTSWRFAPGHRLAVAVDNVDDDERVVAFSSYGPERERARGFTGRGELMALYAHPDAWGTGAAGQLMTHTEERLRAEGFDEAILWVLEDNPRARAFYEKFGWCATGLEANDQYGDTTVAEVEYRIVLSGS